MRGSAAATCRIHATVTARCAGCPCFWDCERPIRIGVADSAGTTSLSPEAAVAITCDRHPFAACYAPLSAHGSDDRAAEPRVLLSMRSDYRADTDAALAARACGGGWSPVRAKEKVPLRDSG